MKKFLSSLLFIFATMLAMPVHADNTCITESANVFDTTNSTVGFYYEDGTYLDEHPNMRTTDYINIPDTATVLTYSFNGETMDAPSIVFFDSSKNPIQYERMYSHELVSVNIPNDTKYVRIPYRTHHSSSSVTYTYDICAQNPCRNLFDKNNTEMQIGGYLLNQPVGSQSDLRLYDGGDKVLVVPVKPLTTYTIQRATDIANVYDRIRVMTWNGVDTNDGIRGTILANIMDTTTKSATVTTLADTQYLYINVRNSGEVGDDWQRYLDAFQVEEGSTATEYASYCPPIKIATTAYNTAAFAPVEAALETAVTTIKDVVANTIVQADAIQNLQDTKQTMPDANGTNGTCPRFRQCLLIETDDGTPQWFPIIDPFKDFVTPILANNANITPVDTQRRHYGDQQLCTALSGTDLAKCTNDTPVIDKETVAYNSVHGALNENEWGYEFKANDIGANPATDNPNNDEGIVYGISKCINSAVQTNTVVGGTKLNDVSLPYQNVLRSELERQYDYNNPTYGLDTYRHCWCKMTSIVYDGKYYETPTAPWVFGLVYGSSAGCARSCASYCSLGVRDNSDSFRQSLMGWAVE